MTALATIIDGSTSFVTITFYGADGTTPVTPLSATWEVIDKTSKTVVKSATSIVPISSTITVTIPSSVNTLLNQYVLQEHRRLIIRAVYGADDEYVEYHDYLLKNEER